jgi:hypothetical protein
MSEPVLKALVLCDAITNSPSGSGQKDLVGAGLTFIRASDLFPIKRSFWVYIELTDREATGKVQLSLMRADSGRRVFFRTLPVHFPNRLQTIVVDVRVFDCLFPCSQPPVFTWLNCGMMGSGSLTSDSKSSEFLRRNPMSATPMPPPPRPSFTFDAIPEDEEMQEELNRRLRKPGEPGYCPPAKLAQAAAPRLAAR